MRITITGKNIELTDGLKEAVEDRLSKLEKYFTPETEAHVTLSVEKERQKIEVTIPVKGSVIRAEQVSNDMYVSIEVVEETIERQLKKYRNKIVTKQQSAEKFFAQEYLEKIPRMMTRSVSFEPRDLVSSQCILKMPACRWNYWDMTSLYS